MTAEQKMAAARFLDAAGGFLKAGYFEEHAPYSFDDADGSLDGENGASLLNDAVSAPKTGVKPAGGENGAPIPERNDVDGIGLLDGIASEIRVCGRCRLCETRTKTVPGEGAAGPLVLVVGEGPGADEDASGRPFVGAAGQLLDKMLASIALDRKKNCFIANVVKCRPPQNRDPLPDETAACLPFFERQFEALRPRLVLAVGRTPVKTLLGTDEGITRLRGNWKSYRGVPLLPTFHPSYLLRDNSQKQFAWEDLKALCRSLAGLDAAYAAETAEMRKARNI
jgi:DNA polymerase